MITIDRDKCINCGSCVLSCSRAVITEGESAPVINPEVFCMDCRHCSAACPVKAVYFDEIPREQMYPDIPEDSLERLIKMRRSVRNYKREVPDKKIISDALNAAAWSPSAQNLHCEKWAVLWGYERIAKIIDILNEISSNNKTANDMIEMLKIRKGNPITLNAPCAIISYASDGTYSPEISCAIATTTLDLLLNSRGLATCWGGYLAIILNKCPEIKHYAGIPEGATVYATLLAGHADGEIYHNPAYRPEANINWL